MSRSGDGSLRRELSRDSGGKGFGGVDDVDDVDFALALYSSNVRSVPFPSMQRLILTSVNSLYEDARGKQGQAAIPIKRKINR